MLLKKLIKNEKSMGSCFKIVYKGAGKRWGVLNYFRVPLISREGEWFSRSVFMGYNNK
jgi:hypothetical protein